MITENSIIFLFSGGRRKRNKEKGWKGRSCTGSHGGNEEKTDKRKPAKEDFVDGDFIQIESYGETSA